MEKFSQYRDKGSGIAPFLPIPPDPKGIRLPFHFFLFICRLPLLLIFALSYFALLQWLPIGVFGRKVSLWCILGIPGIWWIDLQIDGVRKGSLAKNNTRLPQQGSIIASSRASPIDALYLAAIFDPAFVATYPYTRLVEPISLFQAICRSFTHPRVDPPSGTHLVDLDTFLRQNSNRVTVIFPECTTTNGRGILPLSPSLVTTPPRTRVFVVSLRYSPADVTTPLPHSYVTFFWNLCTKPSHCIRIRISEAMYNTSRATNHSTSATSSSFHNGHLDTLASDGTGSDVDTLVGSEDFDAPTGPTTKEERVFLDKVGEALARLGRVKRVGLGVKDKVDFVAMWTNPRRR
ncbi:hypothetical protein PV10_03394 [Exophiala mesophila]|uniref:Phospholipid/glycerol acyltransferase domain-containing protein n=1 Tax=Exophiala mesophila TaxID=212818 RepID=A0A0D1ZP75_EXOME|nr:uncharacterized protein PV10_03394 [Exophiala mesophila]KIV95779.1 hypothetical protein PV10_03394 [Exophiala mesophila]